MPTLHHRAFHKARVNLVEFSEIFSLSEMRADASSPYKALTKKKTSKTPYALIRRNLFHLSTLKRSKTMKATGALDCVCVKVQQDHKTIRHLGKMLQFGLEPMACDAFYVTVFKSFRFHPSTLETERFQKVSTFESVFESLRFHRRFLAFKCGR